MAAKKFSVKFWGARGSMSTAAAKVTKYGGNTSCVEITCGDRTLIFDAGSGIRGLGERLMKSKSKKLHLFFTHCHYDHIAGLPFFSPLFSPKTDIDIWSGHLPGKNKTRRMVQDYMRSPFFPVGPEVFGAKIKYRDFNPRDRLEPCKGVRVETISLNHHDGCIGYRINFSGRSVCYITDTTHVPNLPDQPLIDFVKGADLMIYDGTYTDKEFPQYADFGHSTWQEGARISQAAGVKNYCIFHHRPSRSDKALDKIEAAAKKKFRKSRVAKEGQTIKI